VVKKMMVQCQTRSDTSELMIRTSYNFVLFAPRLVHRGINNMRSTYHFVAVFQWETKTNNHAREFFARIQC